MVRYKMIGKDINAIPTQYRTWVVENEPDFTASQYTGPKSGDNALIDIRAYAIFNEHDVFDFNLPNPLNWITTKKVLPQAIYDSQFAAIDGYLYLFGSENSNKIFKATIDNPADWQDTGATLPTALSCSQLAIVDGYMYLFGGLDGYTSVDTIFSAPLTDPLNWTNNGSLLPTQLDSSQLTILDGYLYLYGGKINNVASDIILQASTSNPLSWVDTGKTLPDKLHSSHLAVMDGYVLLLGGISNEPSKTIYSALVADPTTWAAVGVLPDTAFKGQFVTIGHYGYLFTQTGSGVAPTKIFRCVIDNPFSWNYTNQTVPGVVSQSQLGIVYDRMFLFGGNGSSVIFTNTYEVKYDIEAAEAIDYGYVTRTQFQANDKLDLFKVLGFPYWKTTY